MTDQHDPLRGRNPYPREQIDLLPLHDARRDLLEEIVSDASRPSPARRFLMPVGIAAALAVVAGGAWFAVSGDDGTEVDDPVVAASSPEAPEPETETEEPSEESPAEEEASPTDPDGATQREGRRVITAEECRNGLSARELERLRVSVGTLEEALSGLRVRPRGRDAQLVYLVADGKRPIMISSDCEVVRLGKPRDR